MPRQEEPLAIVAGLHDAGLNLLPIRAGGKAPDLEDWKRYQASRYPKAELLRRLDPVAASPRVAIVCGAVSGGVEAIDFDLQAMQYAAWRDLVESRSPGLLERLVIETSPSGGRHVLYRCESPVPGCRKLAMVQVRADGPEPVEVGGKTWTPKRVGDAYLVEPCGIETRGEGGIVVCWPTKGYALLKGDLRSLPTITTDEREVLISSAVAMNEGHDRAVVGRRVVDPRSSTGEIRSGDDFNERGDVAGVLRDHGWRPIREGKNQYWARPDGSMKVHATLKDRVFFVFSTNAQPFEANKAYSPFAVYTLLDHHGDFKMAARTLADDGFGSSWIAPHDAASQDAIPAAATMPERSPLPWPLSAAELIERYPSLRPSIIDGLLRQGEVMNLIAAPKSGKSWMVLDLLVSVVTGRRWLDRFATTRGRVLLIDNELHEETLADRLGKVLEAHGIPVAQIGDQLDICPVRGHQMAISHLAEIVRLRERYSVVVVDAFYRMLGMEYDENNNSAITEVYNKIDAVASETRAAIVCVHHTTKGEQNGKAITDVGAGGGAQSRAVDAHLVLRDHKEDGVRVLDATVRSWPRFTPVCLRFDFPLHRIDADLDPADLRRPAGSKLAGKSQPRPAATAVEPEISVADQVVRQAVEIVRQADKPLKASVLQVRLEERGLAARKVGKYLDVAVEEGRLDVKNEGKTKYYSLPTGELGERAVAEAGETAQPATPVAADAGTSTGVAA